MIIFVDTTISLTLFVSSLLFSLVERGNEVFTKNPVRSDGKPRSENQTMSYYQETTNNTVEEEVSESEAEEELSCLEEARYNPSMPAYLQLPLGNSESLGKV